jgi:NADH:ubiquinone oxidoreductase subunit
MQETKENSLFAELTPEESASVNGGYYYSDRYYGDGENCGRRRRWVVYRRNCDGSYRRVVRYGYY